MAKLLLGIDIGTYSSKGVLCRPDGTILAEARAEHEMSIPKPGYAEHDADGVWWADFTLIAQTLTSKVPSGDRIAAVAVSAIGACLLPVDSKGTPLRPGILYGVDTRASDQIQQLEDRYGREALVALGGMRLTTQAVGPKILWLRQHEPEIYRAARQFLTSTSYVIFKLTGEYVIDHHTASEFNPLINIHTNEWDDQFAGEITELERLPRLGWSNEIAGQVTTDAARQTGIPQGTPVTFGAVDALSEAISVGVANPGELMIMYGSTAFFILVIEKPVATGIMAGRGRVARAVCLRRRSFHQRFRHHLVSRPVCPRSEPGGKSRRGECLRRPGAGSRLLTSRCQWPADAALYERRTHPHPRPAGTRHLYRTGAQPHPRGHVPRRSGRNSLRHPPQPGSHASCRYSL
jgi:sugar (pentulose or hexulose) kinase